MRSTVRAREGGMRSGVAYRGPDDELPCSPLGPEADSPLIAETVAHLRENGRITLMRCAFQGPPNIVRVHGRGEPVFRDDLRVSPPRPE